MEFKFFINWINYMLDPKNPEYKKLFTKNGKRNKKYWFTLDGEEYPSIDESGKLHHFASKGLSDAKESIRTNDSHRRELLGFIPAVATAVGILATGVGISSILNVQNAQDTVAPSSLVLKAPSQPIPTPTPVPQPSPGVDESPYLRGAHLRGRAPIPVSGLPELEELPGEPQPKPQPQPIPIMDEEEEKIEVEEIPDEPIQPSQPLPIEDVEDVEELPPWNDMPEAVIIESGNANNNPALDEPINSISGSEIESINQPTLISNLNPSAESVDVLQGKSEDLLKSDLKSKSLSELIKLLANLIRTYGSMLVKEYGRENMNAILADVKKNLKSKESVIEAIESIRKFIADIENKSQNKPQESQLADLLKSGTLGVVIDARFLNIDIEKLNLFLSGNEIGNLNGALTGNPKNAPIGQLGEPDEKTDLKNKNQEVGTIRVDAERMPRRIILDDGLSGSLNSNQLAISNQEEFSVYPVNISRKKTYNKKSKKFY